MYSSMKALITILVMMLAVSGCGDLLGTNVVKRELDGSQFEAQCELDMNKFSEIMNENIESQIRCLGENLKVFMKIVKSGKPGYLSRVELERYLADFRPDVKPEVVKALGSVFQLGHLITGDDANYVSKDTVDKVINFALVFNREAALNFGPIFQNESPVTYALHQNHRDRVSNANKAIVQSLRTVFNPNRNGAIHKLNIIELLESFSTETNRHQIEKAKKVLFLKKVLIGGDEQIISHTELERLILNFDHLLLIGLDVARYKYIILKQDSILQLLKRDVNDLYDIITQGTLNNRDGELFFTMNQAIEAAKLFIEPDSFDIEKFRNLIGEVKKIAMKGNATEVRGGELKNLFVHAKSLLQTGTIFHRIYDKFKAQLDSPQQIAIDFSEYRHTYPEQQAELDQFERIVKKYRFLKGEFLTSYYVRGHKRNPDAIFEVALFEYALRLVFSTYGSPSPNSDAVGGYSIDKDQMQKLAKKFENELIELDLVLPGRIIGTADNISLLGTLFQYQSDKNSVMDVNEATEFAVSLFGSLSISSDLHAYMKDQNCPVDEFDRVEPSCYRKHFWKGLCTDYQSYFPLMFESMGAPKKCEDFQPSEENQLFLDRAISAARSCNYYTDGDKEEIYYSEGDNMTIMLALMHAETTILRWDTNNNNYMDADEVNKSYDIYSPALDGFLEDKSPIIKKLKKQIFQYMIKYEQVPDEKQFKSIWKFVKFLLSFNKKAPATRKTIVSLLNVIGEQNKLLQTGEQFDCNLLRNPETIPRNLSAKPMMISNASKATKDVEIRKELSGSVEYVNSFGAENRMQLKDEMLEFSDDMEAGKIKKIKDIRQPNLRALFTKIFNDRNEMNQINSLVKDGSDIEKIGFAVSLILMDEKIY